MAELVDRMDVEADFAARLARQSSFHRKELWALIDLLNPQPIPAEFWQKVEEDKKKVLVAALASIFFLSADQHAAALLPGDLKASAVDRLADASYGWAQAKGSSTASSYVVNSQKKLQTAMDRWYGPDLQVQKLFGEIKPLVTKQQALDDLIDIFGPSRDAGIAATETTGAATAGTHGARDAANEFGIVTTVTWYTERDGRVCPICRPLHGKGMGEWEGVLFAASAPGWAVQAISAAGGPPAHPHCRCWLETKAVKS